MRKHLLLAMCVVLIALAACGAPQTASPGASQPTQPSTRVVPTPSTEAIAPTATPAPVEPTAVPTADRGIQPLAKGEVTPDLVAANTRFGFKLLSEILKSEGSKNVFISPASVAIALTMTYNGAKGETLKALAQSLELLDLSLDEVNLAYAALKHMLETADPAVKLSIANSLWARQGVDFYPDFMQRVKLYYDAQVTALDFADPGAPGAINAWVSQATNGKIPSIVDKISPDSVMFLINAIYFKGAWVTEFDKKLTEDRAFNLLDGSQKQIPMMTRSGTFQYLQGDTFQAVSLPYGKKDEPTRYSMVVCLPNEGVTLSDFEKSLTAENWATWAGSFNSAPGDLVLPKFKLEYETSLNDVLTAMGMGIAFDANKADFGGMRPVPPAVFINQVKHKSFVEVNEEGTEAAAATSVEMGVTSARPAQERFSMIVDRPFFFAIRDEQTGAILFTGSIVAP